MMQIESKEFLEKQLIEQQNELQELENCWGSVGGLCGLELDTTIIQKELDIKETLKKLQSYEK